MGVDEMLHWRFHDETFQYKDKDNKSRNPANVFCDFKSFEP